MHIIQCWFLISYVEYNTVKRWDLNLANKAVWLRLEIHLQEYAILEI